MSLRRAVRLFGWVTLVSGLALLPWSRAAGVEQKPAPLVHQAADPNFLKIAALESRVADLEKKLAAFQHQYATHTHRYKTPPCGYYNMLTLRDYLAKGSTSEGVCVINPAMINPSSPGIPTTPPVN